MKKKTIYRYPSIAAGSLMFAALIGLGSTHSKSIRYPPTDSAILNSFNSLMNKSSNDIGIPAKTFFSAFVDNNNNKWFLTELGIISFNGEKWTLHNENNKVPSKDLKGFAYEVNPDAPELWIASPNGATVASLPIDTGTDATTYHIENAAILSNNVVKVAIGNGPLHWFGTDKGVSAFGTNKWLTPSYEEIYPGIMFQEYPITSMATNRSGDSLYVGTDGAGIARVFRDEVDGISGASVYAQWGPIILPSDKIYSIFIASDGAKWFGTDQGIARHIGNNTLENWTVFTTDEGLVNNFVQAITADKKGNLWFGTKGGVSVYNGSAWTSYTINDGLNSNNILCIAVDKDGVVWIGTDDGVNCYNSGELISYK
jgi:ligand-binding sensor domain-containing protein